MELHRIGRGEKGDNKLLERYNVKDTRDRTLQLWLMYEGILKDLDLTGPYNREKKLQRVVYRMETKGVTLVKRKLDAELKRYSAEAGKHEAVCCRIAINHYNWPEDINVGSGPQLQRILFTDPKKPRRGDEPEQTYGFGLEPLKTTKTGWSTDKYVLPPLLAQAKEDGNKLATSFLDNLIHLKKNDNAVGYLKGYYDKAIPTYRKDRSDWRLHPNLKQTGTRSEEHTSELQSPI